MIILAEQSLNGKHLDPLDVNDHPFEDQVYEDCIAKAQTNHVTFLLAELYQTPKLQTVEFLNMLENIIALLIKIYCNWLTFQYQCFKEFGSIS